MYYVYILKLCNNSCYIGFSSNLKQRITDHQKGNVPITKNKRPLELVFYAAFETQGKAIQFEDYLKSASGFAFRNKRLI